MSELLPKEEQTLDKYLPRLTPVELATALGTCRDAGAQNAANAISKHIGRLEADVERLRRLIDEHNRSGVSSEWRIKV